MVTYSVITVGATRVLSTVVVIGWFRNITLVQIFLVSLKYFLTPTCTPLTL